MKTYGKKIIKLSKQMYTNGTDTEVKSVGKMYGREFINTIKWSDIDLDEDKFVLRMGIASSLPDTKAGRIQTATDWLDKAAINIEKWLELIDAPDMTEELAERLAPQNLIKDRVYKILYENAEAEAEATDNNTWALNYVSNKYAQAQIENVESDRIEALRRYLDTILYQIKQTQVALQAQMAQQVALQQQQAAPTPSTLGSMPPHKDGM